MTTISVAQNLSDAWVDAVRSGKIVNNFETTEKEHIEFGLRMAGETIEYYAKNLNTGTPISATVEEKMVPGTAFRIQYNGYRALRPGGAARSAGKQPAISGDVEKCRFFCQDPKQPLSILRRDHLCQVALHHYRWNAYYNTAPFEKEGHFLWIPAVIDGALTVSPHLLQYLTLPLLEDVLDLFRQSDSMILFFNSLHAGASVNHIHIQGVFHAERLAIEDAATEPSSQIPGCSLLTSSYPANGLVFARDVEASLLFKALNQLQSMGIPLNLILIGERIYLVARDANHEVVPAFPGGGIGSMELAGKIITVDRHAYGRINAKVIGDVLHKVTLPIATILPEYV
jgi:hypothetical protein